MTDDLEHLRRFAATRDADAFAAIVRRYGGPVLAMCRRQLGDQQLAEDATQAVFLVLARRAGKIARKEDLVLSGWLFQTARYACANVRRTEQRRLHHEHTRAAMPPHTEADNDASELLPVLDDAIASLRASDRDAILLRYMNGLSNQAIATELRVSEPAVRKRISRAITRLRSYFAERGVLTGEACIITALDQLARGPIAPHLAHGIVDACTSGASITTSSAAIAKGIVTMTKAHTIKLISSIAAAIVVVSGATVLTVHAQQPQQQPAPTNAPAVAADRDALLKQSEQAANDGSWKEAIDLYSQYLRTLSVEEYRDKKDFGWIHRQYDHQEHDEHAALIKILVEMFQNRGSDDPDFWRLNRLAAEIAQERHANEPRKQHLMEAIKSYPADAALQGNPSQHSSLQHLYNEVSLMMAEADVEAGENFLVESFESDGRFVYVFLFPWREFYAKSQRANRLDALITRMDAAYVKKIEADPAHREVLERCKAEFDRAVQSLRSRDSGPKRK